MTKYEIRNTKFGSHFWRYVTVCLFFFWAFDGFSQDDATVRSEVDTTFIKIGDQINFKVVVEADTTAQVIFPEGQTFSPLETVEAFATDTTRKKDRMVLEKMYALTQFDSGTYKLPAQRIDINGKGYLTDSLLINVGNVPVDTLVQKMFDIKPLMEVEKSNTGLWKILLAILLFLALLGGLLYWFIFRKKPLTAEEKVALLPPYDRALMELKKLENSKYLIQDEYKQYYSELTDIVRSYLEEDVHVSALESTTDQLIDKLEMMKDAGELRLDDDTLQQFKRILQTADLVKFAKSKPETSVAEQDRKSIEQIVIKTHDALPEPTEEELMQQAEYQEELARRQQRKKWIMAGGMAAGAIAIAIAISLTYFGPKYVWDTVTGNPTKKLLEGEWIASSYGYPLINLETPEVLVRQEIGLSPELKAKAKLQDQQVFSYQSPNGQLAIGAVSKTFTELQEPDFEQMIESYLKNLEKRGAKNIITKQEEYATISGVKGIKVYGSAKFQAAEQSELVNGKYVLLNFGGPGFQQQVMLTWLDNDPYAQEIIDRILKTVEVKLEV